MPKWKSSGLQPREASKPRRTDVHLTTPSTGARPCTPLPGLLACAGGNPSQPPAPRDATLAAAAAGARPHLAAGPAGTAAVLVITGTIRFYPCRHLNRDLEHFWAATPLPPPKTPVHLLWGAAASQGDRQGQAEVLLRPGSGAVNQSGLGCAFSPPARPH